jgi:DNA-binding MarR family transcriptional regulator
VQSVEPGVAPEQPRDRRQEDGAPDDGGQDDGGQDDGGQDDVARIVAAWQRERPDLDVGPLEVFSRVSRLARHLDRDRGAAFARHEVEPWEFDVLAALRRAGAPYQLSPGSLLAETLVTSGTMTNRIDRLQARGLVRRLRDPDDGRGVLVRLTPPGRTLVDTALAALLDRERDLLAGLDSTDAATLASLLRRLVAPFDDAT